MNPHPNLDPRLNDLKRLSRAELQKLWTRRVGGLFPPMVKLMLLRDLAWQSQQTLPNGLDAQTQSLLDAAIRQAPAPTPCSESRTFDGEHPTQPKSKRRKPPRPKPQLQPGTKLQRTWRGKTYQVEVIEPGKQFGFRGQIYTSLTQIAQEITGAHWSGPRFFGLNSVRSIQ